MTYSNDLQAPYGGETRREARDGTDGVQQPSAGPRKDLAPSHHAAALSKQNEQAVAPYDLSGHLAQLQSIAASLRIFVDPGQVVELRAIPTQGHGVESGYFAYDHLDAMAQVALAANCHAQVYFTLNPLDPAVLARCCNHLGLPGNTEGARDKDVLCRRWLLIDLDPDRVAGVSATDDEKGAAYAKAVQVRDFLHSQGWPAPVLADSGNGYHLLYRIDLPAADGGLVQRVLAALAGRFDEAAVKVDGKVFNPARICKLYGTLARKGEDMADRPHRWTGVLEVPGELQVVPQAALEQLASEAPEAEVRGTATPRAGARATNPAAGAGILEQARAYLVKLPEAVSGQGGHNQTFKAACRLVQGFGLSPEEALPLLGDWNERCQPPWTEQELCHKLADAAAKGGRRGYLAAADSAVRQGGFEPAFIDLADFMATPIRHTWLVEQVLVCDNVAVMGGPKKSLKTTLLADLAVSLAFGRPFLGRFGVPRRQRVAFISGESGRAAIQDTFRRVLLCKGVAYESGRLFLEFSLPRLSDPQDLLALRVGLDRCGAEVAILDPLYLALLSGSDSSDAGNVFFMGPLLLQAAQACSDVGATPVFCHHTTKGSQYAKAHSGEAMDLEDLAYAGVAEVARQWLIVSPRERFDPEKGISRLWLRIGGSAGQAGLYAVDAEEGVVGGDFTGRRWEVSVEPARTALEQQRQRRVQEMKSAREQQEAKDSGRIMDVLGQRMSGMTAPDIAEAAGLSDDKTRHLLGQLLQSSQVVRCRVSKAFGSARKEHVGWRALLPGQPALSSEQLGQLRGGALIEDVLGNAADQVSAGTVPDNTAGGPAPAATPGA
jgi:hypothetical protein